MYTHFMVISVPTAFKPQVVWVPTNIDRYYVMVTLLAVTAWYKNKSSAYIVPTPEMNDRGLRHYFSPLSSPPPPCLAFALKSTPTLRSLNRSKCTCTA